MYKFRTDARPSGDHITAPGLSPTDTARPLSESITSARNRNRQEHMAHRLIIKDASKVAVCAETYTGHFIVYATKDFIKNLDRQFRGNPLLQGALEAMAKSETFILPPLPNVGDKADFHFDVDGVKYRAELHYAPEMRAGTKQVTKQGEIDKVEIFKGPDQVFPPSPNLSTSSGTQSAQQGVKVMTHASERELEVETFMDMSKAKQLSAPPVPPHMLTSFYYRPNEQTQEQTEVQGPMRDKELRPAAYVGHTRRGNTRTQRPMSMLIYRDNAQSASSSSASSFTPFGAAESRSTFISSVLTGKLDEAHLPTHQAGVLFLLRQYADPNAVFDVLFPFGSDAHRAEFARFATHLSSATPAMTVGEVLGDLKKFSEQSRAFLNANTDLSDTFINQLRDRCFYLPTREVAAQINTLTDAAATRDFLIAAGHIDAYFAETGGSMVSILRGKSQPEFLRRTQDMRNNFRSDPQVQAVVNGLWENFFAR